MADLSLLKSFFGSYWTTLQETSCDDNGTTKEFLCQSQEKVINFDKYMQDKKEKYKKSFDALYFKNDTIYCIEFKNQKHSEISGQKIKKKYIDGLSELNKIFESKSLRICEYIFCLYVVFKNPSNNEAMTQYRKRFKEEEIDLGLRAKDFLEKLKDIKINNPKNKVGCVNDFRQEYQRVFSCSSYC